MTQYLGDKLISGVAYPIEPTRNLGQIIESLVPLTDAGLHLLDGTLINGAGIYSDFVTAIAGIVSTYPDLFVTESDWQTSVTTYGVCGKFVYDSVANTVRLPKITGIIEGTTDATALGDLVEAGLPNITGEYAQGLNTGVYADGYFSGPFAIGTKVSRGASVANSDYAYRLNFNASRSSSIYGNSSTVQPQTIKCYYYIVIATNTKTTIEVDIDEVVTDLNGKADVDFANVTNPADIKMANASMPSGTIYTDLVASSSYTAPADGWFHFRGMTTVANGYVWASYTGGSAYYDICYAPAVNYTIALNIPVSKGQTIGCGFGGATGQTYRFIYAKGSESEAT